MARRHIFLGFVVLLLLAAFVTADDDATKDDKPTVDEDIGKSREASRTDDETVQREEEAIKIDGLNVAQMKELREKAEKHAFQTEVDRMMKLIINSLYRNKEQLVYQKYSVRSRTVLALYILAEK
ncbi:hypothetical protein NP493_155g04000 [Ridgeia piscesae]|uniref:Uncharacterized protein n=1 Tax=Ridgeia piscesae TaxID=27915 RepID=A0AAD9P431_RIDPI|nr:hypothetical protein NP493_155g04000 [Ridgeia piscesae]